MTPTEPNYARDILATILQRRDLGSDFIDWLIVNEEQFADYGTSNILEIYDVFSSDEEIAARILQHDLHGSWEIVDDWHNQFIGNKSEEGEAQHEGNIVKKYDKVWLAKLTTREELEEEGRLMGHCVGSYYKQVKDGNLEIYSLRNSSGPHVTFEIQGSNTYQIKGKQNKPPIEKYLPITKYIIMDMGWNPLGIDFEGMGWGQTEEEVDYLRDMAIKYWKSNDMMKILDNGLNEIYPEIDRDIAERWAKLSGAPESFANKKLNFREKYPDLEKVWAQMLVDTGSEDIFFKYKLNEKYPGIEKEASRFDQINKLVSSNY